MPAIDPLLTFAVSGPRPISAGAAVRLTNGIPDQVRASQQMLAHDLLEGTMDVADWLRTLGLERYVAAFRENDVSSELVPKLTAEDLRDLGIGSVGHRRRILDAIAAMRPSTMPASDYVEVSAPTGPDHPRSTESTAERRQLSVMFCDLIDSTALSSRIDPEDLKEVIHDYQLRVATAVGRFGGFIARYVGDGVLIYFGWPEARETDAERAVRAGLAVAALVNEGPIRGEQLEVRVGIATGLVVVGEPIGSGDSRQQTAVGETPNLAARLQALAGPNCVVIDVATRRQVGGLFDCREFGPIALKGLSDPVRAWMVVGESAIESRFSAFHPDALTPLIGREDELDLLLRRWQQARVGEGQVVLIAGEPGIGKSRLIAELEDRLRREPHASLRYFCSPHHQESALHPVIARWEREAGLKRGDTAAEKLGKLEAILLPSGVSAEDIALFADLLEVPLDDRYPPLRFSPQLKKQKTLDALTRRLISRAREQPVLMVFEDAHWADPSSLELLHTAISLLPNLRILLVASFRPEFVAPWVGHAGVNLITLSGLNRRQAVQLAAQMTIGHVLPPRLLERIIAQADGVPLFIEELTKTVLEAAEEPADLVPESAVPSTLQASLMARLDRLPTAKQVAQIGAVIGREFRYRLLAAITRLPQTELAQGLDDLVSSGLAYRRGVPPDALYMFKHALVQDVAYESLLRSKRRELHGYVAQALEEGLLELGETQPEILAHHCTNAGQIEKAIAYWLKAGQHGIARSALVEAIAQIQKGLDLLRYLSNDIERDRQELKLQLALGGALIAVNGYAAEKTGLAYVRARQLGEQLSDTPSLIRALWGEFVHYHVRGEMDRSHPAAKEMLNLAKAENDRTGWVAGHRAVGDSLLHLGKLAEARQHLEKGSSLSNGMDQRSLTFSFAENARIGCLSFLSITLAIMGFADQAAARTEQALAEARALSHSTSVAFALSAACRVHSVLGNIVILRRLSEELIALATEQHFAFFRSTGDIYRGWALLETGEFASAMDLLQGGITSFRETGAGWILPLFLGRLSTAYTKMDQADEGLAQLSTALALSTSTEVRCYEADLLRLKGELLLTNSVVEAEAHFSEAIVLAREQEAKLFELRASVGLARLWTRQGKRSEARSLLAPIYAWFTEGFNVDDLQEARALLATLGA